MVTFKKIKPMQKKKMNKKLMVAILAAQALYLFLLPAMMAHLQLKQKITAAMNVDSSNVTFIKMKRD